MFVEVVVDGLIDGLIAATVVTSELLVVDCVVGAVDSTTGVDDEVDAVEVVVTGSVTTGSVACAMASLITVFEVVDVGNVGVVGAGIKL